MSDPNNTGDHAARMKALEGKIAALKGTEERRPHQDEHYSQAQMAWRMVIELVAGLGIGFGIGYGLDAFFGTSPWLMIIFIFFGLAAGVQTMMRSAQEIQRDQLAKQAGQDKEE
ncbi:AtpZ/AtpI family protein [Pseudooctadecabacter jejudonensis]|uniref:ATP synthase protein I n=1 Tax=Pseudooctadecabacter jejudonensis TaxID=1391910 RepID=A0A1Y5T7R4_9RHOB|nr:AtpZ/AtpI family protein [Pseudooctadecabacter jejudonensis]SLN55722.1 ATP synthase protein I [Pseudooctadecabacter jejudonensis]